VAEFLYASSHITGSLANPTLALGEPDTLWSGVVNANTSATSRYAIADPVDPLTESATQTVNVLARKGFNSNNPSVAVNLYVDGSPVGSLVASTTITSTTGQTLTGTFNSSEVADPADVEIEVVVSGAGGSPSARNSAQINHIEWVADTTEAGEAHSGGSNSTVTISAEGAGDTGRTGGTTADLTVADTGAGVKATSGGAEAVVTVTATGDGPAGAEDFSGGSTANVTVDAAGSGSKQAQGGTQALLSVSGDGAGVSARLGGGTASLAVTSTGTGEPGHTGGTEAGITVTATGGGINPEGPPSDGSTANITVTAQGVGFKTVTTGTTAQLVLDASGVGFKAVASGAAALLTVSASGGGLNPDTVPFAPAVVSGKYGRLVVAGAAKPGEASGTVKPQVVKGVS
jgi:hypothetical protein